MNRLNEVEQALLNKTLHNRITEIENEHELFDDRYEPEEDKEYMNLRSIYLKLQMSI